MESMPPLPTDAMDTTPPSTDASSDESLKTSDDFTAKTTVRKSSDESLKASDDFTPKTMVRKSSNSRNSSGVRKALSQSFQRPFRESFLSAAAKNDADAIETSKPSDAIQAMAGSASSVQKPFSDTMLSQSLTLTDHIFGLYAFELWHYKEATGNLVNVSLNDKNDEEMGTNNSRLYVKRAPQETDPDNDYVSDEAKNAFVQLTDPSRSDYIYPIPTGPGVGLPGVLWAETSAGGGHLGGSSRSLSNSQSKSMSGHRMRNAISGHKSLGDAFHTGSSDSITWREIDVLAEDPDQPYDERLQCFAKAGYTLAAGIPFDINSYRGIAIFFGNPHADPDKLRDSANSRFIKQAAYFIGAAAALQEPLDEVKAFKEKVQYENWHRMKIKLLTIVRLGGVLRNVNRAKGLVEMDKERPKLYRKMSTVERAREASMRIRQDFKKNVHEAKDGLKSKASRWWTKIHGGNAGIPPSFTYRQCWWTFLGVIITHTILSRLNLLITTESQGELDLVLAPLGALTTLQYNLTAAPASQPRNAVFAQVFALTVAILVSYLPMEPWFRSALAPAIVIPGMAKLGLIHPPAGAAAIVFSSGKKTWEHMGIFLAGVCISIVTSVIINNMSDKRQYPTSWPLLNKAKNKLMKIS